MYSSLYVGWCGQGVGEQWLGSDAAHTTVVAMCGGDSAQEVTSTRHDFMKHCQSTLGRLLSKMFVQCNALFHTCGILSASFPRASRPRLLPGPCVVDAVYVQVTEVTDTDVICVAQNSTVLEGLLTLFHVERSTGDNLSNAQVRRGVRGGGVAWWFEGRRGRGC